MMNIPEFSVAEFSRSIKMVVEDAFGYVKIRGEISGLKRAMSGHIYFSLKDEEAVLSSVCFKDAADLIDFDIADGLQIVAFGRITTFGARSNYQIIVEKVEVAGVGAIMEMLEKRRQKLASEGLFDEIHKKELPFFARRIGVITSQTGAVVQDILHRIEARCPSHVMIYSVAVQGKSAAREVVKAIKFFAKTKGDRRPDLLIIARGGGSIEDLLPFSDEDLVREAFKCDIPIISAIGHETDFSLLDYVADLRAPTPTAAAEIATPILQDLKDNLQYLQKSLKVAQNMALHNRQEYLGNLERYIISPEKMFANILDKFRNVAQKLDFAFVYAINEKQENLLGKLISKNEILNKVEMQKYKIAHFSQILAVKTENILQNVENKLRNLEKLLKANHYQEILNRGFCLIKNKNGALISLIEQIKISDEIVVEMKNGRFSSQVLAIEKENFSPDFKLEK